MKTNTSKMKWKWLSAVVMGMGLMSAAHAVNPDSIVVSVTPNASYSVSIASPMAQGYVFGTVNLAASTISTVAIVVSNNGTISEYFSLAVTGSSPNNWTAAGSPGSNAFTMFGHFNATQPASATFANALTGTAPGTSNDKFGNVLTDVGNSQSLWLRLDMPTSITGASVAQTMTLTVTGQGS